MIIGSSDRVDRAWYNLLLSDMRAKNVAQVLEDCLGTDLQTNVDTAGLRETPGEDDDSENPSRRRVLLMFQGRAIATLQVARP